MYNTVSTHCMTQRNEEQAWFPSWRFRFQISIRRPEILISLCLVRLFR